MTLSILLSATLTFTATATGVEKGVPVEFIFSGQNTDRAYESMFLLDEAVTSFCHRIESVVPRGKPVDARTCRLWPTGCRIRFEPSIDRFVSVARPEGQSPFVPIYTGGTRLTNDVVEANDVMPSSVFSTYSLPQSPIVFNDPVDQGTAYGRFTAACKLEKGTRVTFKMTIDETSLPVPLDLTVEKGSLQQVIRKLQAAASAGEIDARVSFSPELTIEEAVAVSRALSVVDSSRVKLNCASGLFYRAFLPLEKWRDRQERIQQPFELSVRDGGTDSLLFIEEDWTVEGDDPKLTPRQIPFEQAVRHPETTTCFLFASKTQTVSRISSAMKKLPDGQIVNWYVFSEE